MTQDQLSDTAAVTAESVTDTQIDEYFNNGGKFEPENKTKQEEPEAKADDKVEAKTDEPVIDEPKEEKKVNYGALHEERSRRKAEQERNKALLAEVEQLRRLIPQVNQPKQQEPSFEDDPVEALKRENQQIKAVLNPILQNAVKHTEEQKYWQRVTESENAFKQDVPDFDDAVKFLAEAELQEYLEAGFDEKEAKQVIADKVKWIANKAYADEVNPAERFYNLAKKRGYKPADAKEPEAPKQNLADEKLKVIERGQKSNKPLPPASRNLGSDLTIEALAAMNIDDPNYDSAWNKLMG